MTLKVQYSFSELSVQSSLRKNAKLFQISIQFRLADATPMRPLGSLINSNVNSVLVQVELKEFMGPDTVKRDIQYGDKVDTACATCNIEWPVTWRRNIINTVSSWLKKKWDIWSTDTQQCQHPPPPDDSSSTAAVWLLLPPPPSLLPPPHRPAINYGLFICGGTTPPLLGQS